MVRTSDDGTRRMWNSMVFGSAGTVVEWFDYGLYLYLVPVMAPLFFPSDDPLTATIASFGVFAAGSVMRVAGGAFFGRMGDRLGRKRALTLSVLMMTVPMFVTALLPTYDMIGVAAPLLLVVVRLAQGFSAGGEYSGTVVVLVEQAPARRRGLVAATAVVTSGTGILLASLLVSMLTSVLSSDAMSSYGWRVAYGVGTFVALFAVVMRRRMRETAAFEAERDTEGLSRSPVSDALRRMPRAVALAAVLAGYGGILYYVVLGFVPTYLDGVTTISRSDALWITTAMNLLYAYATPLGGWCSDRVGRRPMLLGSALAMAVVAVPMFVLLMDGPLWLVVVGEVGLVLPVLASAGPIVAAIGELFPTRDRFTALAIGYDLGNATFGGTAPLVCSALISVTGHELAPSFYLVLASLLVVWPMARLRETARVEVRDLERGIAAT